MCFWAIVLLSYTIVVLTCPLIVFTSIIMSIFMNNIFLFLSLVEFLPLLALCLHPHPLPTFNPLLIPNFSEPQTSLILGSLITTCIYVSWSFYRFGFCRADLVFVWLTLYCCISSFPIKSFSSTQHLWSVSVRSGPLCWSLQLLSSIIDLAYHVCCPFDTMITPYGATFMTTQVFQYEFDFCHSILFGITYNIFSWPWTSIF